MAPGSRVWLGGDTHSRSVLRVSRMDRAEWVVLAVFAAAAFAVLWAGRSLVALFGALGVAGVGALLVLPVDVGLGADWVSVAYWARTRVAWWVRRRVGLARNGAGGAPGWAGSVALGDVESPVGVVGVAQHARQGSYYSVVLEAQGSGAGEGEAWSAFLAHASSEACPVSHVVQTSRVMAWDPTDHVAWAAGMVDRSGAGGDLVESYAQVIDDLASVASAQRTWVALRIPVAALDDGDPFVEVVRAVAGLVERASDLGVAMRPLDCRSRGALVRHLIDPSFAPDDLRGVDEEWSGVFGQWEARGDGRATAVGGGAWEASVWEVPASQIAPGWLSRDWLYPLVRGVDGAVVRTVVVAAELQSRSRAARSAIEDATSDLAALGRQPGKVLVGDEDAQAGGSAVRLRDLGPDSGAGGVKWSMAVGWHSAAGMWERDARAVRGALEDCSVRAPHRLRYRQDQALAWIAGLGAAWKEGRK